ncbi:MAG: acyl-CoA dehydrogenase family protein [Halioglobus sp.]|nr:acyl-CoA dehydrogenase family protein [Halioglobus sp.]
MDLTFTAEENQFRQQVRDWLHSNRPSESRPSVADLSACREYDLAWQKTLAESGWAGIAWPTEYGGRGLPLVQQLIWYEEYAKADMPPGGSESVCFVGLAHAGPTLIYSGSEEQKSFHLPKIINGDAVWCQGFSEPSAGSDLASLRTKAVIDGDDLVVNGQKVWTSYADVADYQELLVRTDFEAPKHKGITWVICDMKSPGITIRPIKNMAGNTEFCEVFYDDVRIPLKNIIGGLNNGWKTAMSTLSFERGTAFIADQVELEVDLKALEQLAHRTKFPNEKTAISNDVIAARLCEMKAEVNALKAMTYMSVSKNMTQDLPGPEGSVIRLFYSKLSQRVTQLCMDVLQSEGLVLSRVPGAANHLIEKYLFRYSATIGAGTEQIQRSIIAERILGLPKSR